MSWMILPDGYELSLTYPNFDQLEVARLAHSIAQIVRFNGCACRPYSVAEHSLLTLEIAERFMGLDVHAQFATLVHDLHEGITNDQSTPSKAEIGQGWHAFEGKFEHLVSLRLFTTTTSMRFRQQIKMADLMALAIERDQLMPKVQPNGRPSTPWPVLANVPLITDADAGGFQVDLMDPSRVAMTWSDWRDMFLEHFEALDFGRRQTPFATVQEAA